MVRDDKRAVFIGREQLIRGVDRVISRARDCPFGRFAFAAFSAVRTVSSPIPSLFSSVGLTSTRTAGCDDPHTKTCPTPWTCATFCARTESAASYICGTVIVSEVNAIRMGASAGFDLAIARIAGQVCGKLAASRIDGSLHIARGCIDIAVQIELQGNAGRPNWLDDVIWFMPAMRPNCRSSGVATADAMVCGSRQAELAPTLIDREVHAGQGCHRQEKERQDSREQQRRRQKRRADRADV